MSNVIFSILAFTEDAVIKIPETEDFQQGPIEAKALVAVGVNGESIILSVNEDNHYLMQDAKLYPAEFTLVSARAPTSAGLYEFQGFTALEIVENKEPVIVHRGAFARVSI